ncbi:hypothetical protein NL676_006769 [Syzygium grande]|nr:hypothetical protein NL676_006769 [Syzygium grande]
MKMEVSEYFVGGGYPGEFSPEKKGGEQFAVDDLLDFSNEEDDAAAAAVVAAADGFFDNVGASPADSSTVTTAIDSCNSSVSCGDNNLSGSFGSRSFGDSGFAGELCVPYDDLAELEWLSNFVEDSFSTKQNLQQPLHFIPGSKPPTPESSCSDALARPELLDLKPAANADADAGPPDFPPGDAPPLQVPEQAVPRGPLQLDHPPPPPLPCQAAQDCPVREETGGPPGRGEPGLGAPEMPPLRSGRLVPEYRPAASPTFISTKHSNSHRKVLELRRQKDIHRAHHQQQQYFGQSPIFGMSSGADEFLIDHCGGPAYRHMM